MEEIKRPCSFEAASNMEIKVAIRVKVLVSPLLSWVYCSLENLFLSLPGLFNRVFPVSSSSFAPAPLPSFWPLLRFGIGTDTAAGDLHLDNLLLFLVFFRPDCYSGLFSPPGNNLRPGCLSSGHYVCNILTDNRFSFYSTDYRGLAVIDREKIAICIQFSSRYPFFHLFASPFSCEDLKSIDGGPTHWPDNGDYPPRKNPRM